jgi:SET domain-containing protein
MRRIAVRLSPVHGRGLFARTRIEEGARIIEYKGRRIAWESVEDVDHSHTFLFGLENGLVVDGAQDGNSARWINHSCAPNAEVVQEGDRLFVVALRSIEPGTELHIDYNLQVDGRKTRALKEFYACRCGAPVCRGTMLEVRPVRSKRPDATSRAAPVPGRRSFPSQSGSDDQPGAAS